MAKVTRPRLARGTKLTKQHITQSVGSVATVIGTTAIERDNLQRKWAPVRMTWTVPVLDSGFFRYAADGRTIFQIPFPIIPFQDKFNAGGRQLDDDPQHLILDEFGLSFDVRDEAGAICDRYQPVSPNEVGKLNWQGLPAYAMHVSLDEKPQTYFAGSATIPQVSIFNANLGSERLAGQTFRDNPFILTNLNKIVRPYQTYVLSVTAPKLYDATTGYRCALVSLTFSLRFRAPLVVRDALDYTGTVQNQPSPSVGNKTAKAVTQNAIAANAAITEVLTQDNLQNVDAEFQRKLEGGYTAESLPPPFEQVKDDSCYECIIVPMFQNCGTSQMIHAADTGGLPYVGIAPALLPCVDQRQIPILYPWVLHHVVLAENSMAPRIDGMAAAGANPASVNFIRRVGVGLYQGIRSDDFAYQQIASTFYTMDFGATPANVIDVIEPCQNAQHGGWRLISVPLRGGAGSGYYAQGEPIFIGKANVYGSSRTNIAGGASTTYGRETMLEVRMSIENAVQGLADVPHGGIEGPLATYVGYGGNFIYLIGKKTVCGDLADVPC